MDISPIADYMTDAIFYIRFYLLRCWIRMLPLVRITGSDHKILRSSVDTHDLIKFDRFRFSNSHLFLFPGLIFCRQAMFCIQLRYVQVLVPSNYNILNSRHFISMSELLHPSSHRGRVAFQSSLTDDVFYPAADSTQLYQVHPAATA